MERITKKNDGNYECEVAVIILKDENNTYTAYCPALQLSTYGDSQADVKEAFAERLAIFIEEMEEGKCLDIELRRLGWKLEAGIHPHFRQPFKVEIPTELLDRSEGIYKTPVRLQA